MEEIIKTYVVERHNQKLLLYQTKKKWYIQNTKSLYEEEHYIGEIPSADIFEISDEDVKKFFI